jgi:hypothetical protein
LLLLEQIDVCVPFFAPFCEVRPRPPAMAFVHFIENGAGRELEQRVCLVGLEFVIWRAVFAILEKHERTS